MAFPFALSFWQVNPGLAHGPPDFGPGPFGPIGPSGGGSWGGPGGGWNDGFGSGHHGHHGHHSHSNEWDSHEGGHGHGHGNGHRGNRPGRPNRPNNGNNNWNNNGNGNFNQNDWGWFNQHLSQLQRLYSPKHDRHRFHTENQPISTFLSEGFHHEAPQGRMITVGRFNQHAGEIRRRCPHMVPLFAALNARGNTQRLTTNQFELNSLTGSGWYAIQQVGYCVNSRNCGAKKALRQLSVTAKLVSCKRND
ncbi:hypothetical protein ANCDUO_10568 [Ancylostoma duodenale]|uniref:DUF5648 domain-containing protein n=1 Tax=Ancylostoma duodenale TaxID=51022 RepID=A0A0C2GQF2_9BILA|nr:hypothetical protein ANCDUO_10568 [Ancylostoma duodenale]